MSFWVWGMNSETRKMIWIDPPFIFVIHLELHPDPSLTFYIAKKDFELTSGPHSEREKKAAQQR